MKKYAFFDIAKTLYDGYSNSGFYLFLAKKKLVDEFVAKEDKEIDRLYSSGAIDYREASRRVVHLLGKALKGKTRTKVREWQQRFMVEDNRLFSWVAPLVTYLREQGFTIYIISADGTPVVEAIGDYLGVDMAYASELERKNGAYTGRVLRMLNFEEKAHLVHRILGHLGKSLKIGFGDSEGDVDMLSHMDHAFLYQPKEKKLIEHAKSEGWYVVDENNILLTVKQVLT